MAVGLKLLQTAFYGLLLCCAITILGIYSYFIAVLADRDMPIARWKAAVTGMAGAATLYLALAFIMTCCLGGMKFFAFLAILFNLVFAGAFISIAVLTRDGRRKCEGFVRTPLGSGPKDSGDPGYGANGFGFGERFNTLYAPKLETACKLNKVVFILAIIGAALFLIAAIVQALLARSRSREKRYDYDQTKTAVPIWKRKRTTATMTRDAELGVTGTAVTGTTAAPAVTTNGLTEKHHHDMRPSHDTAYTGSTVAPANSTFTKYEQPPAVGTQNHSAYYTTPAGQAVNPYGYDQPR